MAPPRAPDICPICGTVWTQRARFCGRCGFDAAQPEAPPYQAPPSQTVWQQNQKPGGIISAINQGFGFSVGCLVFLVVLVVGCSVLIHH